MEKLVKGKKGDNHFLLGNEAIARGAIEAGVKFVSCYPGTPSSEVVDAMYQLRANPEFPTNYYAEYSVNEKVAMEMACGAALGGARSLVAMKHVGLNVAADPMFTAAYTGMPGGLVILSADDPGCHSSQNEQDNRHYARFAGLPCFEPASAQEAKDMTRAAFEMATFLEQPVLLRTTTRISHMRGSVNFGEQGEGADKVFQKNPGRFVPVPANARKRHRALAAQLEKAREMSEISPFNKIHAARDIITENERPRLGIISSGAARNYVADALLLAALGDRVSFLELGQTWPLPEKLLTDFMRGLDKVLVVEEGAPILEKDIRELAQKNALDLEVSGKDEELGEFGEYSTKNVGARIGRWLGYSDKSETSQELRDLPGRPPNLCPGCAHRSVYYATRKVFGDDAVYSSDIGCYTLGLLPPLRAADFLVCMGSSVTAGAGFAKMSDKPVIAFIGDSTFFHSGLTGIANAVFNNHNLIIIVLDNGTTAMTGHQPNPGMVDEKLQPHSTRLDIEKIISGLGVREMHIEKAHNIKGLVNALEDLKRKSGVRALIAKEPCLLYARHHFNKRSPVVATVKQQGESAEKCARELGCPAFMRKDGKLEVDANLCGSCMVCVQIAPDSFAAIRRS